MGRTGCGVIGGARVMGVFRGLFCGFRGKGSVLAVRFGKVFLFFIDLLRSEPSDLKMGF